MKYIVLEIQTAADGKVATLVTAKDSLNEAMSAFYMILAAAAVSSVPVHAAVLLMNNGAVVKSEVFDHRETEE